jgi:hypothetical protein
MAAKLLPCRRSSLGCPHLILTPQQILLLHVRKYDEREKASGCSHRLKNVNGYREGQLSKKAGDRETMLCLPMLCVTQEPYSALITFQLLVHLWGHPGEGQKHWPIILEIPVPRIHQETEFFIQIAIETPQCADVTLGTKTESKNRTNTVFGLMATASIFLFIN